MSKSFVDSMKRRSLGEPFATEEFVKGVPGVAVEALEAAAISRCVFRPKAPLRCEARDTHSSE
jgi:hypothetical protein